ncbi:DUF3649 domain-containing protein [Alkalimonas sp. NCh-2]|uniref:DUF3649 domain-containing protein n=1 Tax=Alkalimonas sp. NCh-2 TaxID=3144846 RepID=UPI0031F706B8
MMIALLHHTKSKLQLHAGLIARILAATFGGYALAHTLPVALMALLPIAAGEAALAAIQMSFLVYLLAVLWCFAARTATHAWLGLLLSVLVSGLTAWAVL